MVAALVAACGPKGLEPGEGYVDVPGGRVWYRIVGRGTATPVLVLHGGPGAPSYYLKPLAALADERPVVFYDQLGAGHSDPITDTTLLTVDRFVAELAAVRAALGLHEVHILGHSWGTMLATDYLLTKPAGVRSVILASPALSIPRWLADADTLLAAMPAGRDHDPGAVHHGTARRGAARDGRVLPAPRAGSRTRNHRERRPSHDAGRLGRERADRTGVPAAGGGAVNAMG
jgi:pimeloyl-ACP methyl ester carboxylesterase